MALATGRKEKRWIRYLFGGKTRLVATMRFGTSITASSLLLVFCCFTFSGNSAKADEKVFAGWILHMFISGQLKEYTPRGGMAECLKVKRKILRSQGTAVGTRWECGQG